ncbi:ricin-type beta-trefoil lectin protein [Saccharothrix saharensis]|uniref:Ricin-type beta-trefoil lectin protein n=1 Tax=Saccharothrix saharensis TaxID=571190 RepID=A0A543JIJ7_9PSEU|nr:RICIN domain-containing protein [Saccharothrix saharensis]TQM82700.1 ricin-type beta-trefoil lectin protein [Saccharothrix saharensis]
MSGRFTGVVLAALLGIAAFGGTAEAAAQEREDVGAAIISQAPEADGKCLDVYNAGGGPQVQMWWCNGWSNQDWLIDSGYHGGVRLRPYSNTGMCLDAYKGRGVQLVQYRCDSTSTQEFTRDWHQSGFRLRSVSSPSLCVDIYDHGRGNIVQMWDCRDVQHQYWWTAG